VVGDKVCCAICEKLLHPRALKRHTRDVHGAAQNVPCDVCENIFKNKSSMEAHKRITHGKQPRASFSLID
jgi:hypothetical protein